MEEHPLKVLESALRGFAERPELPAIFESEPGGFLYLVKKTWRGEERRDGRRGYLSDEKIAAAIQGQIGSAFSRARYLGVFGDGERAGAYGNRSRQPVPRDVAEAFLTVAFSSWFVDPGGVLQPLLFSPTIDTALAIENACEAMFAQGGYVYCRSLKETGLFGPRADLTPLLRKMLEMGHPIRLEDITFLIGRHVGLEQAMSTEMMRQLLDVRTK